MNNSNLVLVGIPAYNESKMIADLVRRSKLFANIVVVVDDGSWDDTAKLAEEAGAFVIRHSRNCGVGAACQTIFDFARYYEHVCGDTVLITMDADGQHFPEDIPRILDALNQNKYDVVIGSRMEHKIKLTFYKRSLNRIAGWTIRRFTGYNLTDSESGFRAHSPAALRVIHFLSNDYGWNSEALVVMNKHRFRLGEVYVKTVWGIVSPGHKRRGLVYGARIFLRLFLMHHGITFLSRDFAIEWARAHALTEALNKLHGEGKSIEQSITH